MAAMTPEERELRIRRLEAKQRWLWRFGWLWLVVAFGLFMTRASMPSDWWALADLVCTITPLTVGAFYSFLVLGGDIHRLQMEELTGLDGEHFRRF